MKKRIILALFMLLSIIPVYGIELTHNKAVIGFNYACSYYSIYSPIPLSIPESKISADFDTHIGNFKRAYIEQEQVIKVPYIIYSTKLDECYLLPNNSEQCNYSTIEKTEYRDKIIYTDIKSDISLTASKSFNYRICAEFDREYINGKWVISMDNIPKILDVFYPKYWWWNSSYFFRYNLSENPYNMPLLLNYSNGFNFLKPDENQYVWSRCDKCYIYFNNNSDFVLVNLSNQTEYIDLDHGNSSMYYPYKVWQNNEMVLHFNNVTNRIRDHTVNDYQLWLNDSSEIMTGCLFDNCISFDNSYINLDNYSASVLFNGYNNFSVEFWLFQNEYVSTQETVFQVRRDREFEIIITSTSGGTLTASYKVGGVWRNLYSVLSISSWNHIVYTYNTNLGGKLYNNCGLDDLDGNHGSAAAGAQVRNTIGINHILANKLHQTLEEFRLWNKTLSINEIGYLCDDFLYFNESIDYYEQNETQEENETYNNTGIWRLIIVSDKNIFNEDTQIFAYQNSSNVTRYIKRISLGNETTLSGNVSYILVIRQGYIIETADQLFGIKENMLYYLSILIIVILIMSLIMVYLWRGKK